MKLFFIFLFGLFGLNAVNAQKAPGIVKGRLEDSTQKEPVTEATISIIRTNDTSVATFSMSDRKGQFELRGLPFGEYSIQISHLGFETLSKSFIISDDIKQVDFNTLYLKKEYKQLGEVVVNNNSPVVIKGDTVQFKADAFKTKPGATVEDLLKSIPGVQVDKNGTATSQGEQVQKIYVDGKEFFGNDPKMATKNLTADMVESVQVFNDMSEQAKFTKIDDGTRSKAINIKLKQDKRRGVFGRAQLGLGTNDLYESNFNINQFNGNNRVSVVMNASNTGRSGSSFTDVGGGGMAVFGLGGSGMSNMRVNLSGLNGQSGNASQGINKILSAGISINKEWRKLKISGSYNLTDNKSRQRQTIFRQTFFPDDSITYMSKEASLDNGNKNHRGNIRVEYLPDSLSSVLYSSNIIFQNAVSDNMGTGSTRSKKSLIEYLAITSNNNNNNFRDGYNWSNNLIYRKRFKKPGRTITLGWSNIIGKNETNGYNVSPFILYKPGGDTLSARDQNQLNVQNARSRTNVLSTSYTELLGHNKIIELNYAHSSTDNNALRNVYDFNNNTGKYDSINYRMSNDFANSFISNRAGINFRVQKKKYNYQLGIGVQKSLLTSNNRLLNTGKDSITKQEAINFFPSASLFFNPSRTKNLQLNYRGRTNQPSATQLQSIPDVSNPLQVKFGNPGLKQEINHALDFSYNVYNNEKLRFLSASVSFATTVNKIVNSLDSSYPASLANTGLPLSYGYIQYFMPVNLNGSFMASSLVAIGMPLNGKKKGPMLNFISSIGLINDVNLLYKQKNRNQIFTAGQSGSVNLRFKDKIYFGLSINVAYTSVKYTVNKSLNEDYFSQTYSGNISYYFKKGFIFSTDFDYYISSGRAAGFNQSVPMLNTSISKSLFSDKRGEIKFLINDLLNKSQSSTRTTGDNFIEDSRNLVLKRYFMFSFGYKLNRMGGKK